MWRIGFLVFLGTSVVSSPSRATFNNVIVKGYSVYTLKFTKTLKNSNSVATELPEDAYFDHLEFKEQYIPVLTRGSISDIESLDELTLESCKLVNIEPGAFENVPMLRKVTITGNLLEEIKEGVFSELNISTLDLGNNRIKAIEAKAFNNMPNLLSISLHDNYIDHWDKRWFENDPLLNRISMQNNSLQSLPDGSFQHLNSDIKFGKLALSLNLIFSYNKIREIDNAAFQGLKNINNLWLDNNQLTDIPEDLLKGVNVQELRIGFNQINCFKGDLGVIMQSARTVHVDGNPFDCTCLGNIMKWKKENGKDVYLGWSESACMLLRINKKMKSLSEDLEKLREREAAINNMISKNDPKDDVELLN